MKLLEINQKPEDFRFELKRYLGVTDEEFRELTIMQMIAQLDDTHDEHPKCEGCSSTIRNGDKYACDAESGVYDCEDCAATYGDMLDDPTSYYLYVDGDQVYFTAETAKQYVDKYIAGGGKLTDKFGLSIFQL